MINGFRRMRNPFLFLVLRSQGKLEPMGYQILRRPSIQLTTFGGAEKKPSWPGFLEQIQAE